MSCALALGTISPALATSEASPDVHFSVDVTDSDSSTAGNSLVTARYTIFLSGLLPNSQIQLFVDDRPNPFSAGQADGAGELRITTSLPADLEVGGHDISAVGTTAAGVSFTNTIASLNVTAIGSVNPGSTGDGTLSLVVPAGATSTFNAANLVNNVSTSMGQLGEFSVNDQRTTTKQGWTLHIDVTDFALSTNNQVVIPKSQLATVPQLIAGSTEASGITLGSSTSVGSASYPRIFAEASAQAATVGHSTFDAALIFVAPQQFPVGTYNATVTLTLVSK